MGACNRFQPGYWTANRARTGRTGRNLLVHGRKHDHTLETCNLLEPHDVNIHAVAGELDTDTAIQAVIDAVNTNAEHVDILYNNAAISNQSTPIFDFTMDVWQRTFQVNLFAMIRLCGALVPALLDEKGPTGRLYAAQDFKYLK